MEAQLEQILATQQQQNTLLAHLRMQVDRLLLISESSKVEETLEKIVPANLVQVIAKVQDIDFEALQFATNTIQTFRGRRIQDGESRRLGWF